MPRRQPTGQIRVWFAPAVANIALPTTTEINAGTDLTPQMRRDGLSIPRSPNMVDASDVSSLDNKQSTGTRDVGPAVLKLYRDDVSGTDVAWNALVEGTAGFLIVRRFGGSTVAAASSQRVEVYPVEVSASANDDIAENADQLFTSTLAVTGLSNTRAQIA